MKQVYDEIRQTWVSATPEEIVRQSWLHRLVYQLNFPKHLLVIEKELKRLPHLQEMSSILPERRIDILSFSKGKDGQSFFPLLLLECKTQPLSLGFLNQVSAYNTFVKAFYVAIANRDEIYCCYFSKGKKIFLDYLPSFDDLVQGIAQ